ncbi:hypothetical protein GCM10027398_33230 [Azotobacter salinestris]
MRDLVRDYVLEQLADDEAVLVLDEAGFLKQGRTSCGVARQYTGSAGKITNCQIGVFAAYVSRHGQAFIDQTLYLPRDWTADPERLAAAHVPEGIGFSTKPRIAEDMIERAIAANTPFAWVAADSVNGVNHLETALRRAGKGYVLGVKGTHAVKAWIDRPGLWTRGLLIRRRLVDGELAYFATWAPIGTSLEKLAWVEGHRWSIESAFETAKGELGLDHNATRSWHGWHRHVSLVMLAFALLARVRHQANAPTPPKTIQRLIALTYPS